MVVWGRGGGRCPIGPVRALTSQDPVSFNLANYCSAPKDFAAMDLALPKNPLEFEKLLGPSATLRNNTEEEEEEKGGFLWFYGLGF